LKRYVEETSFAGIFTDGKYNCVSATLLYSMLAREYNIPHRIVLTPVHTYLYVIDEGDKITIELTAGEDGFDLKLPIDAALDMLLQTKQISEEELQNKGKRLIYQEFVENSEIIDFDKLMDAFSANLAIEAMGKELFDEAYALLQKCRSFIVEREEYHLIYLVVYSNYLEALFKRKALETIDTVLFSEYQNHFSSAIDANIPKALGNLLQYYSNERKYEKCLSVLAKYLDSSRQDFSEYDNLHLLVLSELVQDNILTEDYEAAYKNIQKVMAIDSTNTKLVLHFTGIIKAAAQKRVEAGNAEGAYALFDENRHLFNLYPNIKESYVDIILYHVMYFERDKVLVNPTKYIPLLEKALKLQPDNRRTKKALTSVYHEIAMQKVRQNNLSVALKWVRKGLKVDPDSKTLQDDYIQIKAMRK
jgi:tetratricopeptide (TPR) repeat protein